MSALGDFLHRVVDAIGAQHLHDDVVKVEEEIKRWMSGVHGLVTDTPAEPDTATTLGPKGRDGVNAEE